MLKRIYGGETEQEQLHSLRGPALITLLFVIVAGISALVYVISDNEVWGGVAGISLFGFTIMMAFVWGLRASKGLGLGLAAKGFGVNIVLGVVGLCFGLALAYILGIFAVFLGVVRYIYLEIKNIKALSKKR